MLYAACILTGAVNLLIPLFCRSALSLGVLFPMLGTSQALFWPVYEAWLAERSGGGQLLHRIRNFNTSWSIGIMLGPFVASRLFQWGRFVPFYFGIAVSIINLGVILSQARIRSIKSTEVQQDDISEEKLRIKRMYLHIAWAANFASWFMLAILRYLAPKLMLEMGISESVFGNLMLVMGILQTMMFIFLGTSYTRRWHYKFSPLLIFQLIAIAACLCIWLTTNISLRVLAFGAIGTATGVTYFSSIYYSLHGHTDKGAKSGFHEAILGGGVLLGPFLGGAAADLFDVNSPYLLCAVMLALGIIAELVILNALYFPQEDDI